MEEFKTPEKEIARNEPCPCGSGKKYKRCHGVSAAPKLSAPKLPAWGAGAESAEGAGMAGGAPGAMGFDPSQIDPQMMAQVSQMLQRMPKSQLNKLQNLVQKAMSGKDVTREAAELEASLPPDLKQMMMGFSMAGGMGGMAGMGMPAAPAAETDTSDMTLEKAREIVAKAAAEGKLSEEKAKDLLGSLTGEGAASAMTASASASEITDAEIVESTDSQKPAEGAEAENASGLSKLFGVFGKKK